ncbi:hypothetical protein JOM56_004247 [Amanita muscaria]
MSGYRYLIYIVARGLHAAAIHSRYPEDKELDVPLQPVSPRTAPYSHCGISWKIFKTSLASSFARTTWDWALRSSTAYRLVRPGTTKAGLGLRTKQSQAQGPKWERAVGRKWDRQESAGYRIPKAGSGIRWAADGTGGMGDGIAKAAAARFGDSEVGRD